MSDFRRRAILILAGMALSFFGGLSNQAAGGLVPDNRLGALTVLVALVGMALMAVGIFSPSRERP